MPVPLLDVNAQNLPLEEELKGAFERVLRSGQFILGPEVQELETRIARMIGVRHGIGVSSGTDALLLALMSLDIGPGDEVLCPTFTFFATAGCIARLGATPVFVDSCPICFNFDVAEAERRVSSKTRAIVPVHLFGQAAEMDRVTDLARRHGLSVIEDAAQSLGARYRGKQVGTMSRFGVFSFFPSKNLGGFGDGGMVVTDDDELAVKAKSLRAHGAEPKYFHKYVGGNFRLDPLQAALLRVKLPRYETYTAGRVSNAAYYTQQLRDRPGIALASLTASRCLDGEAVKESGSKTAEGSRVLLPVAYPHNAHIWNQYTLRVLGDGRRDALRSRLTAAKIGSEIYYPVPLHRQECFEYLGAADEPRPVAERLSKECLSIPVYPELTRAQQDEVIAVISAFAAE
ncbi:MAG TPA: DegT/DnrJ/EryC1/StrS family aminotransferase [Thermoanaerobaculia bacterium]